LWDARDPNWLYASASDGVWREAYTSGVIDTGTWFHAVLKVCNQWIWLYLDGVLVHWAVIDHNDLVIPVLAAQAFVIGGCNNGTGGIRNVFDGSVATARLWNTTLTEAQAEGLAAGGALPQAGSLLLDVCFQTGTAIDLSPAERELLTNLG